MHSISTSTPHASQLVPQREIVMHGGQLLVAGTPRYDDLDSYLRQFATPLSQLKGLFSFYDPCFPERTILVECTPEPICDTCGCILDYCECPF